MHHVHFSGIAGKGIAPAAGLALQAGFGVTGDDLVSNHRIPLLEAAGANITIGRNVDPPSGTTLHVRSSLVAATSNAQERSRLAFVNDVFSERGNHMTAIAGSIGKSTSVGIVWAAHEAHDPGCYIGADLSGTLCGGRLGAGASAVVEADEYKDAYRELAPDAIVLLNVVPNHADHFGQGTEGFSRSFASWVDDVALSRESVMVAASARAQLASDEVLVAATTLGGAGEGAEWTCEVVHAAARSTTFELRRGRVADRFSIPLTGVHAATAAAFGVLTARTAGLRDAAIQEGLANAQLPWRRQTLVYRADGVWVYDDNARLPAQASATIDSLRQRHGDATVVAVISPWGKLNRRDLGEWARALARVDVVAVLPVGDAGMSRGGAELDDADLRLVETVQAGGGRALPLHGWDDLPEALDETVFVTLGYDAQLALFERAHAYLRERYLSHVAGTQQADDVR